MRLGRLRRPMAMMEPGIFLSQPGTATRASYHWAPITVSIESAMMSLDWREYFIPSVPIEMPSLTPMVLKQSPTIFFPSFTLSLMSRARSFRWKLQEFPSHHMLTMPAWGSRRSCASRPAPWSMAWEAAWERGSVTRRLYMLSGTVRCAISPASKRDQSDRNQTLQPGEKSLSGVYHRTDGPGAGRALPPAGGFCGEAGAGTNFLSGCGAPAGLGRHWV